MLIVTIFLTIYKCKKFYILIYKSIKKINRKNIKLKVILSIIKEEKKMNNFISNVNTNAMQNYSIGGGNIVPNKKLKQKNLLIFLLTKKT